EQEIVEEEKGEEDNARGCEEARQKGCRKKGWQEDEENCKETRGKKTGCKEGRKKVAEEGREEGPQVRFGEVRKDGSTAEVTSTAAAAGTRGAEAGSVKEEARAGRKACVCRSASARRLARQHVLHHHRHRLSERPAAYRSRL